MAELECIYTFYNAGYLRSGLQYFLEGFSPVHLPVYIKFSPSTSRRALSNEHLFIQVKTQKTAKKLRNQ